ncbi:FecR family protein [Comamonas composti]|uniref:FecR family protein n=1 Tax=Comamonas composti TaxID=408558 RepID=UPI00047CEF14|nr:FecR domain-containing protein [Comamonas composti]
MPVLNGSADDAQRLYEVALRWFVRRRDAGWSVEEEASFEAWLAADVLHATAYAQCSAQWQEMDAMPADLLQGMRSRLAHDKLHERKRLSAPALARRRFLAWPAASAMVAAAAAGMGYMAWQHLQMQPVWTQAYRTEQGQQQQLTLEDGSRLRLDTQTQVEVRFYRQRREVQLLDGQAVFEVQHDGRPFHVLAGGARVTVVGTRFAVRYTPRLAGNSQVQVAVEEGKVRVSRLQVSEVEKNTYDLEAGALLTAGQQTTVDEQGVVKATTVVPADGIAPWRDQRISFVDVPLAQALAELERYGATGLRVKDPAVGALRLSGTFDPMETAALYKALPRVLPVRLQVGGEFTDIVTRN